MTVAECRKHFKMLEREHLANRVDGHPQAFEEHEACEALQRWSEAVMDDYNRRPSLAQIVEVHEVIARWHQQHLDIGTHLLVKEILRLRAALLRTA